MPNWLTEVLKLLGLTTPFIYAAASYRFFHWLDQKASGPAKEAFSSPDYALSLEISRRL